MHEMGIADAILQTAERIRLREKAERLRSITVEVGELSGVVPHFLSSCWEAVAAGTPCAQTRLLLHPVPAMARCEDCREAFVADVSDLRCPCCRGGRLTPLSGTELTIAEIELCDAAEE